MFEGAALDLFLSIAMICVIALVAGAIALFRKRTDRKRAWLMLVAALVLFANILLWAWPV